MKRLERCCKKVSFLFLILALPVLFSGCMENAGGQSTGGKDSSDGNSHKQPEASHAHEGTSSGYERRDRIEELKQKHGHAHPGSRRIDIEEKIQRELARQAASDRKGATYYKDQLTYRPRTVKDHLLLFRQDMAEFAEERIDLPGGAKYRMRPSKHKPWRYLAIGGMGKVYIIDTRNRKHITTIDGLGGSAIDWNPKKNQILSGVRIKDIDTNKIINEWDLSVDLKKLKTIYDSRFFPDGERVIVTYEYDTGTDHKSVAEVWLVKGDSPEHIKTFGIDSEPFFGKNIVFSPDGKYFTMDQKPQRNQTKGRYIQIWNAKTLQPAFRLKTKAKHYVYFRFTKPKSKTNLILVSNFLEEYVVSSTDDKATSYQWLESKGPNTIAADIEGFDVMEKKFLLSSNDGSAGITRINNVKKRRKLKREEIWSVVPGNGVGDALFGPEGEKIYLVTGSGDLWIFSLKKLINLYERFTNVQSYYRHKLEQSKQQEK